MGDEVINGTGKNRYNVAIKYVKDMPERVKRIPTHKKEKYVKQRAQYNATHQVRCGNGILLGMCEGGKYHSKNGKGQNQSAQLRAQKVGESGHQEYKKNCHNHAGGQVPSRGNGCLNVWNMARDKTS